MERISNFHQDESGGSAAEYSLLIALIALACVYAISVLGTSIIPGLTTATNAISSAS